MKQSVVDFLDVLSGLRKFIIMILLIVVGIIFRITNLVNGAEFVDLLKGTVIAFFSANSVEHLTGSVKEWLASKSPIDPPVGGA